jgi:O-antigen/teichoic acid export membrane protein
MVLDLYYKLFYIGLLPFTFLTVFGDVLFRLVFSSRWEEAGVYASYISYLYLFRLTSSATAPIFAIRRRQNMFLIVVIIASAAKVGGLALGALLFDSARLGVLLMSVGGTVVMFLFDMYLLRLVRVAVLPVIVRVGVLCALALVLFYGLRLGLESYWPLFKPRVPGLLF